mgnify:CR=1 FL=1
MTNSVRARAALAIMRLMDELAFDPDQLRDRRGRWVKDPRSGARPSEGGGAGAGGRRSTAGTGGSASASTSASEPHPVDERAELRAIQLAEIDRDVAAGRRRDAIQTRIDRAEIAIRRHADAVKMHDNEPDDQRWTDELREAEADLTKQGVKIEPYGYTQTGHGGSTVRYNAFGAHDERAGREAELDARPGATGPAPEAPQPKPDEYVPEHIREVQQYLTGEKRATLPLTYLYGGPGREAYEKYFTPEQRERVLGELLAIEAGLSEDARDRPVVKKAIDALRPLVPGDHQEIAVKAAEGFLADRRRALTAIESAELEDVDDEELQAVRQTARRAQIDYARKQVADADETVRKLKQEGSVPELAPEVAPEPPRNPRMNKLDRQIAENERAINEPGEEYLADRRRAELKIQKKARETFGDQLPGETAAEHEARVFSKIKAAVAVVDAAEAAGWRPTVEHGTDSGGMPFVTVEVANPDTGERFSTTWHTRKNGTYQLFGQSMVTRVSVKGISDSGRRYGSTRTPTKLREIIEQNPTASKAAA